MNRINNELARAAVFVCVGSSGVVYPAAGFIGAVRGRASTYYVGPAAPENAGLFDEVIAGAAGEVLPGVFEL